MGIIRRGQRSKWFSASREMAQDESLSLEAVGLMSYLLSKPSDWQAQLSDIERRGDFGREKRRRIVAELERAGYFERHEINEKGKFDYEIIVHEEPLPPSQRTGVSFRKQSKQTGEPSTGEPSTGEPSTGEPSTGEPSTGEPSTENPSTYMRREVQEKELQEIEVQGKQIAHSANAPAAQKRRAPTKPLPEDFRITADMRAYAAEKSPCINLEIETEKFINHARANDRRCVLWDRAWMNWILKAKPENGNGNGRAYRKGPTDDEILAGHEEFVRKVESGEWKVEPSGLAKR